MDVSLHHNLLVPMKWELWIVLGKKLHVPAENSAEFMVEEVPATA